MKLFTILLLLLLMSSQVLAQKSDDVVFQSALPSLQEKTRVPLRMPTYLATKDESYPLLVIVEAASPIRYELRLAFTPDCTGGNACRYGIVSRRAVKSKTKRPRGKAVRLTQGIIGYFVDATCGANCSDSTLSWQQGDYRYMVGIKAVDVETLRKSSKLSHRKWRGLTEDRAQQVVIQTKESAYDYL